MKNQIFFLSILFFCIAAQTATAILPPQIRESQEKKFKQYSEQARKNSPEVLDIQVKQISSKNDFFIAEARVLKVIRSQIGIKAGDSITIKYSDISLNDRKYNEKIIREQIPGPGFKEVLYLLEEGKNTQVYLKSDSSNTGLLTLAADIVSFEPLTQTNATASDKKKTINIPVQIHCSKTRPEVCNQEYEPVCAQQRMHVYCIKAPCNFFKQVTFSNSCSACSDTDVSSYVKGACEVLQ